MFAGKEASTKGPSAFVRSGGVKIPSAILSVRRVVWLLEGDGVVRDRG